MCGEDTLGVQRIEDPNNPWVGTIPIPPMIDTQLDQIVIQDILIPLREKILQALQAKIQNHRPDTWFEVYSTIFILLNSIEASQAHSNRFCRRFGRPVRIRNLLSSLTAVNVIA